MMLERQLHAARTQQHRIIPSHHKLWFSGPDSTVIFRGSMAGILDNKLRIMDVIMTLEGRRQIAAGKFVPQYASFTDNAIFYEKDVVSGSDDASQYLYFEAASKRQDQIVIENDDSGLLIPYDGNNLKIRTDGSVYSASIQTLTSSTGTGTYNRINYDPITSTFSSMFELISGSILDSLTNQQLIRTSYPYELYNNFEISTGSVTFRWNNFVPFRGNQPSAQIGSIDPFFIDRQLSHLDNFEFLPPTYIDDGQNIQNLGVYTPIKEVEPLTYEEIMQGLVGQDSQVPLKEKFVVNFSKTSISSNIFMQMFEGATTSPGSVNSLKKLDCIDFGEFKDENDKAFPFKRIFFVGKVYASEGSDYENASYQAPSFVNLFTIVAE
jgi:hypothetical protein